MNSKLLSLSLLSMNYITLNAIHHELPSSKEHADEQPYAALVFDQIDNWINEVNNQVDEEPDILTIIRLDIETELIEGNYLDHGVDTFIERVQAYFRKHTNGAYANMMIDVAKELDTKKILPN